MKGKIPVHLPPGPAPCPFCDSDDVAQGFVNITGKAIWTIACNDCSASLTSYESHDDVVLAWNRRPAGRP
jgi:Lar family restriction alleviation protein